MCHGTEEQSSYVKMLRLSPSCLGDRTGSLGTGGGHCVALWERSAGTDSARIRHSLASSCSRSGAEIWEELTGAAIKDKSS